MIPYGRQSLDEQDIAAVEAVLRSDWLTQGPVVPRFERAVADYVGARHALAMNSATAALHVACLALGVGPEARVWTVPNTFAASANCARYCGAAVGFVDIDPRSYCLDMAALAQRLAQEAPPDVVVAVDFAGQPCDVAALAVLKARYGFRVIEDAAHAIGAEVGALRVGALPVADVTVFSFHPVKIITTGEGGMLLTQDDALARRAALLRNHGIERDPAHWLEPEAGAWHYEQQMLGWNYRMTDIQAALGVSQLERLPAFLARRRALAARYDALLADLPLTRPWQAAACRSAYHLYPILLRDAASRRHAFDRLRAAGIGVQVHYLPVHLHPYYRALGFKPGDFPVAEDYASRTLSLPLFPSLDEAAQDTVVATLKQVIV